MLVADRFGESRDAIAAALADDHFRPHFVAGSDADWQSLQADDAERFDALIIDLEVDSAAGIALLQRIKSAESLAALPVMLLLPLLPLEQLPGLLRAGLAAGASHFLARPFDVEALRSFVRSAIEDARRSRTVAPAGRQAARLRGASFVLATLHEAEALAALIALAAPQPEAARLGISELLINAVEHGNLGITYAEKGRLKALGRWREEIDRRAALPENRDKRVRVSLCRDGRHLIIRICDEGCGFDWHEYLDFDPQRALDPHGRGIAIARLTSFDSLVYEAGGHVVVATIVDPAVEEGIDHERD